MAKKTPGRKAVVDIPQVLIALGLASEDWGPNGTSSSTYAQLAAGWRGSVPVPAEATMEAKWLEVQAGAPAALTQQQREQAKAILDSLDQLGKALRAFADVVKDEVNLLRDWITSFKAAVAGAATLAALKTAVAALPNVPDRDLGQLRAAIRARLDSGAVDAPPP